MAVRITKKKTRGKRALRKAVKDYFERRKILNNDARKPRVNVFSSYRKNEIKSDQRHVLGHRFQGFWWLAPWEYKECCLRIKAPTEAEPATLFNHAKSVQHIAYVHNVFQKDLRDAILATEVLNTIDPIE